MADDQQLAARVRALAAPLAEAAGLEVLDVVVRARGSRHLVRVTADSSSLDPEEGLGIDAAASLSRRLGAALDEHDPFPGAYDLEVSSPGADRPLRTARDFARNIGREVRLHHVDGHEPRERRGNLVAVTEASLALAIDGADVDVLLEDVDHGTVVLPW